ncbi:MAG: sodium:solute symporter [Phycisphaerales bacterium]|nr:sodium:solute symporter [Phycisphaerales bacterium]
MQFLNAFDYLVIVIYFVCLLALGFILQRKASASLEDYFLGGKKLPWWALGASGMSSMLDVAGTMLIVSFLFMLGPRGLYIEFRGGAVLVLAVMLLWVGKWNRRSNCMTGAEWMVYRFGDGIGGQFARIVTAIAVMVGMVGGLAYMTKGVGLFLSMFVPLEPLYCAIIMISVATLYTMAAGFYGVVYTDLFQAFIIFGMVIVIIVLAVSKLAGFDGNLEALAEQVTGTQHWTSAAPAAHVQMPRGYESYNLLLMFAFFYLMKNVLLGMGLGQDSKYYGARNERECGKLTFIWTWLMMFRWPMMMSFAVLGLFMVRDMFPDPAVIERAAQVVHASPEFTEVFGPDLEKSKWDDALARVMRQPERFPQLSATLSADDLLGEEWQTKLKLVSYEGTVNPERIMPAVIVHHIPMGLRGLLIIALLAASMSTFDTNVNMSAAYFVRDIYQRYWRPAASNRELVSMNYVYIVVIVILGFVMGYSATSINNIWAWLMMGLGAGMLVPGMLKFYWWRFNAGGVVVGTVFGLVGAVVDRVFPQVGVIVNGFFPAWFPTELSGFVYITLIGLAGAVLGTFASRPTHPKVLENFYRTTRPFGLWGPLRRKLPPEEQRAINRENRNDIIALPFTLLWQITLFLLPMLAIVGNWSAFGWTFALFAIGLAGMYVFWYRELPPPRPVTTTMVDIAEQRD